MQKSSASPIIRRPWGFTRFIKRQGFHGIYLVANEVDTPLKVGITNDPVNRLSELQVANFKPMCMQRFWWLPGRKITARIERSFKEYFADNNIRGEWFDLSLDEAEQFIESRITDIGSWAIKQVHMIDLLDGRQRRRFNIPAEAPSPLVGAINPSDPNAQGYRAGNIIFPALRSRVNCS